jgi:cytochrome c553
MNTSKIIGVVVSLAIFGVMGYMLINDNETTQSNGFEEKQTVATSAVSSTSNTSKTEALTEEEQKVKDLKDENREFAVSNLYILKCAPCHGDNGKGVIGPILFGKSEQELIKKLYEYKEGKVKNSMMAGLLTNSTDDELKLLAREISNFGK